MWVGIGWRVRIQVTLRMTGGTNAVGFSKIWLSFPACGDVVLTEATRTDVYNLQSGPVTNSRSFFLDVGNYKMPDSLTFGVYCSGAYQTQRDGHDFANFSTTSCITADAFTISQYMCFLL